ncbi:MAG: pirin family protein [Desulfobulbia bacterium]
MKTRKIKRISTSAPTMEGAGVHLHRVFGFSNETDFDPFLLLDDSRSDNPSEYLSGFPWHPHRGIETITYVLQGDVEHGDSLGNSGIISSGDVQWMTAGSGIIHQEMPKGDSGGSMHGFQLWANLPAKDKMMAPRYRDISSGQIPEVTLDGGITAKIIAGTLGNVFGPVSDVVIDPLYLDCTVPPDKEFRQRANPEYTVFIYVIGGTGSIGEEDLVNKNLVLFDLGDEIVVSSGSDGMRFLLLSGKPLREPIAWRGPIVMNSQEQLDLAFREFHAGNFIKHQ